MRFRRSSFRRSSTVVLLACVVAGGVAQAGPALAAGTGAATARDQAASGWLARQFTGGSHLVTKVQGSTFPNQGGTIDAIFAFAATHSASAYSARAQTWLASKSVLSNYIGNGTSSSYAGATAKVMLAAEVRGASPTSFGGVNLVSRLGKLLTKSGRYSDHSSFGDFSNAFSQALAIIALGRHGGAPAKAVSFLVSTECGNGGFPLDFGQKTCTSDPDATAMAVQALIMAGRPGPAQHGLRWLASVQKSSGGFVSAPGAAANANSTGLAGEAFSAGKWPARAGRAKRFLLGLQVSGCARAKANRGALAFDKTGFKASTAVSATAQGILGLADVRLGKLTAFGSSTATPRLGCGS
jgi:hypothetical protein